MQNFITRAVVSNKRINTFFKDFNDPSDEEKVENHQELKYDELSFNNIYFSYNAQDEIQESFTVKDINFQVDKGEVVFIVGGNGSGKSTFINILTGLYKPLSGEILLNGKKIHNAHANYKKLFSVIYTDNYIFSKNYDDYILKGNKEYLDLLKMMEMESIITNDEDESVRRKFSKGQSKRMSLIFSLLEDRPILVLDEWAADQDPHFRKYFYETIIPKMKKQGKTIIAVTHDDKYFNYADRIIKFDSGQIIKDIAVKDNTPLNIL
jgi:putative ATP-binding cassette transporter